MGGFNYLIGLSGGNYSWEFLMSHAIREMLKEKGLNGEHVEKTPERFIKALNDYTSGYRMPVREVLIASFEEKKYNQMIFMNDMPFISHCIHHLAPFSGKMHFAYIPNGKIVGLSKIPRVLKALSKQFQIQEKLTNDMADVFFETVNPQGCGVIVEATHFCICARGVEMSGSYTRTCSLRGNFLESEKTKAEFLLGAHRLENSLL